MRIPRGFADEVRGQVDIVRVVSDYVTLRRRGQNWVARCPFHSEKTPSFNVHPGKGIFKCFGCNVGGSVFDFVAQIEGVSFPEAVRIVAQKSGIPIPTGGDARELERLHRDRESVLRLNEWADEFFQQHLLDGPGSETAREYVASRGIGEAARSAFRIGYAPDSWDSLLRFLQARGAEREELANCGLVIQREDGGFYDRFRGRLMFPITDSQKRIIAFGGRIIGEGEPKYLNSPETAVYTKGRHLYGLALSKNEIRHRGFAILVEGYLDCIIPFQEGVQNIVASLGTALTSGQVRLLRRYMEEPQVVVNFDNDEAGQSATLRSIDVLLAEGFKVNVVEMPAGKDPDEFVRTRGAEEFLSLMKESKPYIDFIIETALTDNDVSRPAGKVRAINAVLPHLAKMRDKVARLDYAAQMANRLMVDSKVIREELKRVAVGRQQSLDANRIRAAESVTPGEQQLLEIMLASSEVRRALLAHIEESDYGDLPTAGVFSAVIRLDIEGIEIDYATLSERVESDIERSLISGLLMSDLAWAGGDDFDTLFKKGSEALASIRARGLEKRLDMIQIEMVNAEREADVELLNRLYQEKLELKRRKLALSAS